MQTVSTSDLAPMLRKLEYWGALDARDREALLSLPHELKSIEAAKYIVREGDKVTHSCLMISGFSYRHKIVGDGARQIVAVHMSGDMVDLQNALLGTADHSVQALTRSKVAFIPRDAIKQLAFQRPAIGQAMWYDTLVDGSIFREWIANVGRRDARARVAHLLCEFAIRLEAAGLGDHTNWELPMTQEQIADAVGLTSVHVNRTLKVLEKQGLIERSKRAISTSDWKALAKAGDFDITYLHLPQDKLHLAR